MPLVHDALRQLAHQRMMGESRGHPRQTTALVNKRICASIAPAVSAGGTVAFPRGVRAIDAPHPGRCCPRAEEAQTRGRSIQVSWDEALAVSVQPSANVIALDEALQALAAFDEPKSRIVELRFFGGWSVEETAEALQVSPTTVMRDWGLAKAWLLRELDKT